MPPASRKHLLHGARAIRRDNRSTKARLLSAGPLPRFVPPQTPFKTRAVFEGYCQPCHLPFQQTKEASARLNTLLSLICQNSQGLHVFAATPFSLYLQIIDLTD